MMECVDMTPGAQAVLRVQNRLRRGRGETSADPRVVVHFSACRRMRPT